MHDYFNSPISTPTTLSTWTKVYQDVRLPRAQKAQLTSRQAGDLYELQGPLFDNLSYDECLPIIAENISGRMKWVWGGDIDAEYDAVVTKTFGGDVISNLVP
jgi:salicylate hydroxylase